ncbi:hypothetical protein [Ilumatobacter sp.]|uniref:hypothetical protein n=1 Tax=Ilumatobacter sp. TaxID=1967498 RepID=UPI003C34B5BB
MKDQGGPPTTERRRRLLGIKLRALVSEHLGSPVDVEPVEFGTGAGFVLDGAAWVIVDGPAGRTLGASLAWAVRNGATSLDVVVDDGGGQVARRAGGFDFPVGVWFPEERALLPIVAETRPEAPSLSADHLELLPMIEAGGARPHTERGVVSGEVRGLEVCRVVDEPTIGNFAELNDVPEDLIAARVDASDGIILEVGVGANDREAFQLIHGHRPTQEALADVVSAVTAYRSLDAPQHPLNRMAPERFLRWQVEEAPALLGLTSLEAIDPPVDRQSMKHPEPCAARGIDESGAAVAVVFSAGVDLDLIPFVADVSLGLDDEIERIVVAVPGRDLVPVTADLAALLVRPIELVAL